jgi:predicted nucleic acid-binding protein
VLVAAIRSDRGASRALLTEALAGGYKLLVSVPLALDYEAVMTREEHLKVSGLSRKDVVAVLNAFALVADPVRLNFRWRPMLPDAEDDMVLETAINGHAAIVATLNTRHFARAADFGIDVCSPGTLVTRLRSSR